MKAFAGVLLAFAVAAAVAVSAETADDRLIAEHAKELPAASFAELAAAADTQDVFAVLDAISDNIAAEQKHAEVFYESYKRTAARDMRRYRRLIARTDARRVKSNIEASRIEQRQLRRNVNANVRSLSRAVARFRQVRAEARRSRYKKKAAMRHLNNKIADRRVFLRVLKAIRKALSSDKPANVRFSEALQAAHANGATADNAAAFIQLAEQQAAGEETDNADEAEADAAIDEDAFEMENAPSQSEMTEVEGEEAADESEDAAFLQTASDEEADAEDEDEADEEADEEAEEEAEEEADAESEDESEDESEEEAADEEADSEDAAIAAESTEEEEAADTESADSEAEAEAEADSEDGVDEADNARMVQVLERLSSSASNPDGAAGSSDDLIALVDELIASVRRSIARAKRRKVEVLAKYSAQMQQLQRLAAMLKSTVERLRAAVHAGRARLAEMEHREHALAATLKDSDSMAETYRKMYRAIRNNWRAFQQRYEANSAKRERQLARLAELKRRLAAVERSGGLHVDVSNINLRYRWKAYPFGRCQAACGPSHRKRKVVCLSFSGAVVKNSFCQGQKKPKSRVKCQRKMCPVSCVVSPWKPRGRCSNACGRGVRLHTRKIVEPARFGGRCPQAYRLTRHRACRSFRACPDRRSRAAGLNGDASVPAAASDSVARDGADSAPAGHPAAGLVRGQRRLPPWKRDEGKWKRLPKKVRRALRREWRQRHKAPWKREGWNDKPPRVRKALRREWRQRHRKPWLRADWPSMSQEKKDRLVRKWRGRFTAPWKRPGWQDKPRRVRKALRREWKQRHQQPWKQAGWKEKPRRVRKALRKHWNRKHRRNGPAQKVPSPEGPEPADNADAEAPASPASPSSPEAPASPSSPAPPSPAPSSPAPPSPAPSSPAPSADGSFGPEVTVAHL